MFAESALFGAVRDPEIDRIVADMQNIERENGLRPDESYSLEDAPPDWLALNTEFESRADAMTTQLFRDGGLADLARMYQRLADPDDLPRGPNPAR